MERETRKTTSRDSYSYFVYAVALAVIIAGLIWYWIGGNTIPFD